MDSLTSKEPMEMDATKGIEADADPLPQDDIAETMENMIPLADDACPDAVKDGDPVSTTVDGVLKLHDGKRMLVATMADGKPVMAAESEEGEPPMDDTELEGAMADFADKNTGLKSYIK